MLTVPETTLEAEGPIPITNQYIEIDIEQPTQYIEVEVDFAGYDGSTTADSNINLASILYVFILYIIL